MRWLLSFALLALLGLVQALSASGNRLLVILEDEAEKAKYTVFLGDLEERGFTISYESPKSEDLALFHLGERTYDHVLLLPGKSKGLGPKLTPENLLSFINAEGNVLLALSASSPTPTAIISLLLELDIHLPADRSSVVVDHFSYDTLSSPEKHDVVLLPRPDHLRVDVRNYFQAQKLGEFLAFPHGIGHTLGNASPLLTPVLRAPRTAYSYSPKDEAEAVEDPFAVGSQLSLVSVMQARNSARLALVGSAEMLQNEWFDKKVKRSVGLEGAGSDGKEITVSNRRFAKEISGWAFKEIGVLRVGEIKHYLDEGTAATNDTNPEIYRVKNRVTYTIELSEWTWNHWKPYVPEGTDSVQLEFSMLSPFHRLPLKTVDRTFDATVYGATFILPDQHGIFNFRVNYKRPFLTNVDEKNTVSVRHFAHNEYPRSWVISGAWPWITGIGATVTGWTAFVALWLWSAPKGSATSVKKSQ